MTVPAFPVVLVFFKHRITLLPLSGSLAFSAPRGGVPILGTLLIVPIMGTMQKAIYSKQYRRLVEWLKTARESRGWSMRDLGERIDEPHSLVQKVESMERRLDAFELVQYCRALEVDPHDGLDLLLVDNDLIS